MTDAFHAYARARIDALERDTGMLHPAALRERVLTLEWLEEWLNASHGDEPLRIRAQSLRDRLADEQARLCGTIRTEIRRGKGAAALRPWRPAHIDSAEGYDHLDALFGEVFAFAEPTAAIAPLEPDMVFYQPTPVRHVFDLVERAGITEADVFVDLGSGLGHVPMLVSILTGARCIGVERERLYVEGAQRSAEALQLDRVTFVASDVRDVDLSSGTAYYLYTPFTGAILRSVLDALQGEAQRRRIRLITFGPCTGIVEAERWLGPVGSCETHRIAVFQPFAD